MTRPVRIGLIAGIVAGPLFYLVVLAQIATRAGFSLSIHPISLLALGPGGWVQTLNFAITGLLYVVAATALRRVPHRRVQGWLLAIAGIGFVIVALNPADPFMGFPPGTTTVPGAPLSRHAQFHGLGFMVTFSCIILAALVTAFIDWRVGKTRSSVLAMFVCLSVIAVLSIGLSRIDYNSESFFILGILAFGWVSIICWEALRRPTPSPFQA